MYYKCITHYEQVYAKLLDETVVEAVKKLPLSQKT